MVGRTYPSNQSNNADPNDSNNKDSEDDDESIILEWEDDRGRDIRHLFSNHPLPTMTQQIDAAMDSSSCSSYSGDENDGCGDEGLDGGEPEEDRKDGYADGQGGPRERKLQRDDHSDNTNHDNATRRSPRLRKKQTQKSEMSERAARTDSNIDAKSATNSASTNLDPVNINNRKKHEGESGGDRTPPPSKSSLKKRQLGSGEAPATISKVVRRRKSKSENHSRSNPTSRKVTISPLFTTATEGKGDKKNERKFAKESKENNAAKNENAGHEVDRVFDFLGLDGTSAATAENYQTFNNDSLAEDCDAKEHSLEEMQQHERERYMQHLQQHHKQRLQPPVNVHLLNSLDIEECDIREVMESGENVDSPLGSRRLQFEHDATAAGSEGGDKSNLRGCRGVIKLPPLHPLMNNFDAKQRETKQIGVSSNNKIHSDFSASGASAEISEKGKTLRQRRQRTTDETSTDIGGQKDENDDDDDGESIWKEIERGLDKKVDSNDVNNDSRNDRNVLCSTTSVPGAMASVIEPKYVVIARTNGNFTTNDANTSSNTTHAVSRSSSSMGASSDHADYKKTATRNDRGFCNQNIERPHPSHPSFSRNISTLSSFSGSNHFSVKSSSATSIPPKDQSTVEIRTNGISSKTGEAGANIESIGTDTCVSNKSNRQGNVSATISSSISSIFQIPSKNVDTSHKFDTKDGIHSTISASVETNKIHSTKKTDTVNSNVTINTVSSKKFVIGNVDAVSNNIYNNEIGNSHLISNRSNTMKTNHKANNTDEFDDFDFEVDDQDLAKMDAQVSSLTQQRNSMDPREAAAISRMVPPPSLGVGGLNGNNSIANHRALKPVIPNFSAVDPRSSSGNIQNCLNSDTAARTDANALNFDDDDDDWGAEDLAKIDLKVSMTQSAFAPLSRINSASSSNNMNVNGDRTINTNASNYNPEQGPSGSSINKNQSSHEFSDDDDDFADVDFAALDDKIVQHQQMTQAMDGNHRTPPPMQHLPPPPPPHAPIYNRRVATNSAKTTLSDGSGPSYLKFSRYVIRSVQVDVKTFTKTIAVVTWTSKDEIGDRQESERLRKICEENNGRYFDNPLNAIEIDGCLHLRGEWYHTQCHVGDVIHLCSLSGTYATDKSALPVVLHSNPPEGSDMHDDLLLVVHPDVLISPTLVSEAVKCPRLSVLQSRLGSTGLSAKSAVIGTLRHDLFEKCLQERDVSRRSAVLFIRQIIRDRAETLLGCGITKQSEAFAEVMKTVPQIQKFHATYTSWSTNDKIDSSGSDRNRVPKAVLDGMYTSANTLVSIEDVHSTEEWAMVPELGLKGIVDATVMARTKPVNGLGSLSSNSGVQQSLMPVELKTGHVQNPQQLHLAQLSLYTLMLRARHGTSRRGNSLEVIGKSDVGDRTSNSDEQESGAADGGMLLYLNHEAFLARHVKPMINEAKTLIGQRNSVVCDLMKASRPRGIKIQYEDDDGNNDTAIKRKFKITVDSPPPSNLPPILPSINTCERCYKNRECMMYSSTDAQHLRSSALSSVNVLTSTHKKLIDHFTGHLSDEDFEYFRTWDRLIDLEKHASSIEVAKSWLFDSAERESKDGKCIGGLVIDVASFSASLNDGGNKLENNENTILRFRRSRNHSLQTSLLSLSFEPSSYVIISTDGTSFTSQTQWKDQFSRRKRIRHKMHLLRATVDRVMENCIDVIVARKEISLIKRLFRSGASNEVFLRPVDFVNGEEMLFRLDKDESYNGAGLLLQNLVNFFTLDIPPFSAESYGQTPAKMKSLTSGSQSSSRRRRMNRFIVKLSPEPRFRRVSEETLFSSPSFLHGIPGCTMDTLERDFNLLNSDQKNAVLKVVSAEDFALIQGLPGTGKTATIAFLTRLLVALGKRVLLTSYTHSAVDNLIIKLIESKVVSSGTSPIPILRIGRESSCHPRVHSILAQNIAISQEKLSSRSTDNAENPSVDYLHMVVSDAKIVGVSALSAPKSPLLAGQHFDYVIVDEAGQISQPAVLGAIMAADSFVLVGDHMQLPPLVCSEVAEEAGYGVSMLMRLAEGFPDAVAKLTIQYRMHEDICRLSNTIAYQGLLKCGNKNIQHGKLQLSNYPPDSSLLNLIDKKWIKRAINPDEPVVFLDTDGKCSSRHGPRFSNFVGLESDGPTNEFEISIVRNIIQALTLSGLNASSIGIITPFRSQLRLLNDDLYINQCKNDGLELSTIDRFQGRDKPAILFSLVRSNSEGKSGKILQDFRRLNVAFSRAKHKFVMIGSFSTLKKGNDVIGPILKLVHEEGWIETVGSFKA